MLLFPAMQPFPTQRQESSRPGFLSLERLQKSLPSVDRLGPTASVSAAEVTANILSRLTMGRPHSCQGSRRHWERSDT